MHSLIQSQRVRGSLGEPLPVVFKALEQKGIVARRGQLILACAGPGTGKSALQLIESMLSKVPTLYLSADSDAYEQLQRAISVVTGMEMAEAGEIARARSMPDKIRSKLAGIPVRFDFESQPTVEHTENLLEAYAEMLGDYPTKLVVDNISDVINGMDEESTHGGHEGLLGWLKEQARDMQMCVVGLHHVNASHATGTDPIPLNSIKGQIHRIPQMVLTIFRQDGEGFGPDHICVSAVKNRGAKFDSSGEAFAELEFDGARMQIRDPAHLRAA